MTNSKVKKRKLNLNIRRKWREGNLLKCDEKLKNYTGKMDIGLYKIKNLENAESMANSRLRKTHVSVSLGLRKHLKIDFFLKENPQGK